MVSLRKVNRNAHSAGFNKKPILLILGATMVLILWGFQKFHLNDSLNWLFYLAIGMGAGAFASLIVHIVKIWKSHRKKFGSSEGEE